MKNLEKHIRERRSVRTFNQRVLTKEDYETLCTFIKKLDNPFGLVVEFCFIENMNCPVVVGTELYVGAKIKNSPYLNEAFGYTFEKFVLYAQSLGIGTVWIGGTMDRTAFEKAMNLKDDEIMPCISPVGYPSEKMSIREMMMRKGVKADERKSFEEIVYLNDFEHPLNPDDAGDLFLPLEMVRLAPSAVNKQPWRMLIQNHFVHFYLERSKNFGGGKIDMQKIDLGIALCHFEIMANDLGISTELIIEKPDVYAKKELEYIASYKLNG